MEGRIMATMFDWLNYNRPDLLTLHGPDSNGNYRWDESLPNQEEIANLIAQYTPEWEDPRVVPLVVTPRQMRIALVMSGISIETVEAMIDSLPEPQKSITRITWEYSTEFQRTNPLLVQMAPALGLTEAQVDQMFKLAITL